MGEPLGRSFFCGIHRPQAGTGTGTASRHHRNTGRFFFFCACCAGRIFFVRATQGGEPKKAQARGSGAEVNGQRAATKGQQGHRWQESEEHGALAFFRHR